VFPLASNEIDRHKLTRGQAFLVFTFIFSRGILFVSNQHWTFLQQNDKQFFNSLKQYGLFVEKARCALLSKYQAPSKPHNFPVWRVTLDDKILNINETVKQTGQPLSLKLEYSPLPEGYQDMELH
jgi:hypothetical protein